MTAVKDATVEHKRKIWRSRLSYSMVLLIMMLVSGTAAGIYAYKFGKEALQGVRPSPPSVKLPTVNPAPPSPAKQSFFLDEFGTIAEMQAIFRATLGGMTRPQRTASTWQNTPFLYEAHYQTRLEQIRAKIDQATALRLSALREQYQP